MRALLMEEAHGYPLDEEHSAAAEAIANMAPDGASTSFSRQPLSAEAAALLPSFWHFLPAERLAKACEVSGFKVVLAQHGDHPGYPHHEPGANTRENTQVLAIKN